jgi:hypothetical protein
MSLALVLWWPQQRQLRRSYGLAPTGSALAVGAGENPTAVVGEDLAAAAMVGEQFMIHSPLDVE